MVYARNRRHTLHRYMHNTKHSGCVYKITAIGELVVVKSSVITGASAHVQGLPDESKKGHLCFRGTKDYYRGHLLKMISLRVFGYLIHV